MKNYAPKDGTGWEEGPLLVEGARKWRTPIEGGRYLVVTVASGDEGTIFAVSRVDFGKSEHEVPLFEDLRRIQDDFGVRAWGVRGTVWALSPSRGATLLCEAVDPSRVN